MSGLGSHVDPLQLTLQRLASFAGLLLLLCHALGLLIQPRGVVALPRNALATIQLQDPASHMIQEIPVVRDADHGASILLQVLLQPVDGFSV